MLTRPEKEREREGGRIDYSILEMDASEIARNIFIGDRKCAANYPFLKQLGVRHIVVAGDELAPHFPQDFNYLHIKVRDSIKEDIGQHFETVCEFMGEALKRGEGVLVHCAFGVSRSATLVIAFLMRRLGVGYQEAFSYVRRKRPVIRPNAGFQQQLQAWG